MTGIDDPYEVPENAEIVVQTSNTVSESVRMITDYLVEQGFFPPVEDSD